MQERILTVAVTKMLLEGRSNLNLEDTIAKFISILSDYKSELRFMKPMPCYFMLTISLVFVSCKPSEARRPLSNNSGSFIDASIERNKQLNNREYAQIDALYHKTPKSRSISSEFGFWYAYNTQIETDAQTPKVWRFSAL